MMEYILSKNEFQNGKMFDSNNKLVHKTGYRFKLFPFVTQPNSEPVENLDQLVGTFLCKIEDIVPEEIKVEELIKNISDDIDIELGTKEYFDETIKQLFFDKDGKVRLLNLKMLSYVTHKEVSEEKVADYLADVLGSKSTLKNILKHEKDRADSMSNVLEKKVLDKLNSQSVSATTGIRYYRVVESLKSIFEKDFEYVLCNTARVREYLVPLLELYFFSYTAQTCMQIDRFLFGERNENIPLYFCLEWEKTSQSRKCFDEGWRKLQRPIEHMFAHVVVLEILNHTEGDVQPVDYIALNSILEEDPSKERYMATCVDEISAFYREAINDCPEMKEIKRETYSRNKLNDSVRFLFDSVRSQFENSVRSRPYDSYASKFESFCHKYLKSRGRNGLMLSLSEETLIFLTKLALKNKEQMRLKDVFDEFEKRGVFLDELSKEQVALYYERLNLIEKKSDSGDAKYVKRIL